jgi:vacuolar-type H+-ATPase subunit C/Vma6
MNDSYTAARIHVMRTKLLGEYSKLLKMSEKELLAYLQTTAYRDDINALRLADLEDLEVVDAVIASNQRRELAKLSKIASPNFKRFLEEMQKNNDLWNIAVIADAISGNTSVTNALQKYARMGTFDPVTFTNAKSLDELAKASAKRFPQLRNAKTAADFQEAAQKKTLPKSPVRKFLIDEQNIIMVLLRKRSKTPVQKILKSIIRGGTIDASIRRAAMAPDLAQALQILYTTSYAPALEDLSLVRIEAELHAEVLRRMRHTNAPLGIELLLRYLAEKEIEHANLRMLLKGKRLGLSEQFIREHVIA